MKVAEMEKNHGTRTSSVPRRYHYCRHCGRAITQKCRLCQACKEFESMMDEGKPRICRRGHQTEIGRRCEQCKKDDSRSSHARKTARKAAANAEKNQTTV